uniref:Uncharacterized protein n=1 Tax=Rhizophora mucronata TaxID=61149 RepID=A0A2P2IYQ6_RHIMU
MTCKSITFCFQDKYKFQSFGFHFFRRFFNYIKFQASIIKWVYRG